MHTPRRRTLVRAAAVAAVIGGVPALSAAAAVADPAPAAPAAHRVLVKSLSLADGRSTAYVYRVGQGYEADIVTAGAARSTLSSRGGAADGYDGGNGLHVALGPDGRLSSSVNGAVTVRARAGQPDPVPDGYKTAHRTGQAVPASEVRAAGAPRTTPGTIGALRLDAVADRPGGGALLLAAGGGIAAVGAAGLGFAMMRRGRSAV